MPGGATIFFAAEVASVTEMSVLGAPSVRALAAAPLCAPAGSLVGADAPAGLTLSVPEEVAATIGMYVPAAASAGAFASRPRYAGSVVSALAPAALYAPP